MNRKETLIILLIACIIFTPILVAMGIKGAGALVYLWGLLGFLWWLFYGKDMAWQDKVNRGMEEGRKIKEEQEAIWNAETPKRRAEIERQRRAAGLVTDSSFKEFMKKMGFEVVGDIKIPEQTFEEYYYGKQPKNTESTVKIITHKSYDELKEMGICNVRQLLGDYHKYFHYEINNINGGFYGNKVSAYDNNLRETTVNDLNNMCVDVTYYSELDKNFKIQWKRDNIYYVTCDQKLKEINRIEKDTFKKWTEENEIRDWGRNVTVSYNEYTIYRDSGVVVREGNSKLSENEREFVIRGRNYKKGSGPLGIKTSADGVTDGRMRASFAMSIDYFQVDVFNLPNL